MFVILQTKFNVAVPVSSQFLGCCIKFKQILRKASPFLFPQRILLFHINMRNSGNLHVICLSET